MNTQAQEKSNIFPLYEELLETQEMIKSLKKKETKIKAEIIDAHESVLKQFGSVTVDEGDYKLVITTPKKVKWNQEYLAGIYKAIETSGQDASEYIKIAYDVAESKFKAWPEHIQNEFMPARTLSQGSTSLKLERKENDA